MSTYLCQKVVATSSQGIVPVALQTTRSQRDDDDGTFEQALVRESVLLADGAIVLVVYLQTVFHGADTEDTDAVDGLEATDFLCSFQAIHDGKLNVHQDQVKAARFPHGDGFLAVDGRLPAHFEPFHESLQQLEVDIVILDQENVDRGDGSVEEVGDGRFGGSDCLSTSRPSGIGHLLSLGLVSSMR